MPAFARLQPASFGGITYPVSSVEVQGGIRDHIHEYPHSPGGAPEKLGRKLYTIRMEADFHATFTKYPNLWPQALGKLRKMFEDQATDDLVIPTVGTIKAYARTWSQHMTNTVASGEKAVFEFVEDQTDAFLTAALLEQDAKVLNRVTVNFNAAKALADFAGDKTTESLFDQFSDAANSVFALGDQLDVLGNLLGAKLLALTALMSQADNLVFMQDPANYPLIKATRDLWSLAQDAADNLQAKQGGLLNYRVPGPMSMSAVSTAIYGDASHTVELMQLNVVEDLFAIPAGTNLNYYPAQK